MKNTGTRLRLILMLIVIFIPIIEIAPLFFGIFGIFPRRVEWRLQWTISMLYSFDLLFIGGVFLFQPAKIIKWLDFKFLRGKALVGIGVLLLLIGSLELHALITRWIELNYFEI